MTRGDFNVIYDQSQWGEIYQAHLVMTRGTNLLKCRSSMIERLRAQVVAL